jgi:hypothetical protein
MTRDLSAFLVKFEPTLAYGLHQSMILYESAFRVAKGEK